MAYPGLLANYANAILAHIEDVANGNSPSEKITPVGYLRALAEHNTGLKILNQGYESNGHITDVRIAYQQRGIIDNVATADNCDIDVTPAYLETTTSINNFVKLGIYIDDRTIARYPNEASKSVMLAGAVPSPANMFMQEHLDTIIRQANAIFQKVNKVLLAQQLGLFGVNVATGSNAAKTINFPQSFTSQALAIGMTEVLDDYQNNEGAGRPIIVGGGLLNKYNIRQKITGPNFTGTNTAEQENDYEYYYDPTAALATSSGGWGAQNFGVFQPGSVLLLEYNKYGGDFAGDKLTSYNFKLPLPVVESVSGASLGFFELDAKIIRINCPTTINVGPYGTPTTVNEGWALMLSKYYDQYNIQGNAYATTDRLYGNNGTFLYTATNS